MKKLLIALSLIFLLTACNPTETPSNNVVPIPYTVSLNPGNDIIELNGEFIDAGCILTINNNDYNLTATNTIDTSTVGEYELLYSKSINGSSYQCKRIVKVIENEIPMGYINAGIDTIHVNETHIDTGVTTLDGLTGVNISVDSNLDITTPGSYQIIYHITDSSHSVLTLIRVVTVIE